MIHSLRQIAVKAACAVAGTALLVLLPVTAHAASTGEASATHPQLAAAAHSTVYTGTARPATTATTSSDTPRSAAPNVSCNGYGCDGQWPDVSGCGATAITAETDPITDNNLVVGQIELRYSTACRTVWARVSNWSGYGQLGTLIRNAPYVSYYCSTNYWSDVLQAYSCYTRMAYDGGTTSYAGGTVWDSNGAHNATTPSF